MKKTVSLLLLFILFLSGCSAGTKGGKRGEIVPASGTLNLSMRFPDTLDPTKTTLNSCKQIYDLIFDGLVYVDQKLRPVSRLAENCSVSEDGLTISFKIRENVKWHDGADFTAGDVEYTVNTIKENEASLYYDNLKHVQSVSVSDSMHIKFLLDTPNVNILNLLDFPIIPKHISNIDETPIGTGPYKFVELNDMSNMLLVRNDGWFGDTLPTLEYIDVKILNSTADTVSMIRLGDVDAVVTDILGLGDYGTNEKINIIPYPSLQYEFIGINYDRAVLPSNILRQALSYSIDREKITQNIYFGYAEAASSPIPSFSWLYDKGFGVFDYDIGKAREKLAEAGYMDVNGDGYVEKSADNSNEILAFSLIVNDDNMYRVQCAEQIVSYFNNIGIKVTLDKLDYESYLSAIENREYDLFMGGYNLSPDLDFSFMLSEDSIESGTNVFGYSSYDMDKALSDILSTRTDKEIKSAYSNLQMIFSRDVPVIGICFKSGLLLCNSAVEISDTPACSQVLKNIYDWRKK